MQAIIQEIRSVAENATEIAFRVAEHRDSTALNCAMRVTIVLAAIQADLAAAGRIWDGEYEDAMERIAWMLATMPRADRQAICDADTLPTELCQRIRDIVLECTFVVDSPDAPTPPMTVWDALRWALEWLDRDPSMDPDWQAARNNAADYMYQFKAGAVTVASLLNPLGWALVELDERADSSPEFAVMMGRAREALRLVEGGAK